MPPKSHLKKYSNLDNFNEVLPLVSKQLHALLLHVSIALILIEIGLNRREIIQIITPKRGIFLRLLVVKEGYYWAFNHCFLLTII